MSSLRERLQRQPLVWLLVIFAAVFLANGPEIIDQSDFLAMSQDMTTMLGGKERRFLYSSPLNFVIADLFNLQSVFGFYLIHGLELAGMLICVAIAVRKKVGARDDQIRFLSLLALTPLWLVTVKWIGKSDPVLIGGFFLLWAYRTHWRTPLAIVLILAHREIGSLICVALYFLEESKDRRLIAALIVGNAALLFYHYGLLPQPPSTRMELMGNRILLQAFLRFPTLYLLSAFSWYWVVLLLNRPNAKEAVAMGGALVLSLISEDFTRDFALAALPAVVFHLERVVRLPANAKLAKLVPLCVLQIQVAALGPVYRPMNSLSRALSAWIW